MIRRTNPEEIPRDSPDEPPCVLDEGHSGDLGESGDPLFNERGGTPPSQKYAMHDREEED